MARILVVDDEPSIVLAVNDELIFEGYEVDSATDGHEALAKARALRPDVLLLDLMLPGLNGFESCRQLRPEMPGMGVIIFTVRGQEADRITGFESGADDYVTKPFSLREMVARVKVGLRRQRGNRAQPISSFGVIELDRQAYRVTKRGAEVALTRKEFEILELLARQPGEVITRDGFLDQLWGEDVYITHRVIDTHVAALRKKIEDDPNNPKYVLSVRGIGYKLGLQA
jgi:DNA-binding response OmpR family regulator